MSADGHRIFSGIVAIYLLLIITAGATEQSFYERFLEACKAEKELAWDDSFVQTNNFGSTLTNAVIPYSKFAEHGELAGIKLGMTMDDVVAAWGKPRNMVRFCGIGPRFWYGPGNLGDLSLCFRSNNLVLIAIQGSTARSMKFDNNLTGRMNESEWEQRLGVPALRDPDQRDGLYAGNIAYRTGELRTDLLFTASTPQPGAERKERLAYTAVSLERLAKKRSQFEQKSQADD